jgi:hypothetical protein
LQLSPKSLHIQNCEHFSLAKAITSNTIKPTSILS